MERARRTNSELRIEITPLIDVVFLLLTFFIFALVLTVRLQVTDVRLPVAGAGTDVEPMPTLVLALKKDGQLTLNETPVEPGTLIERLDEARAERPDAMLLIAPDEGAPTGELFRLMDMLEQADVRELRFLRRPADLPDSGQSGDG